METVTTFKIATTPDEFEQVHRLNYRTFVEEIPQHAPNADGRHVDKFHADNTYVVGVREGRVIAQIAIRRRRPFSLDAKLPDLDRWLPTGRNVVELRLLAVDPAHRNGPVPAQLLQFVAQHCIERGDDVAVISGALRRLRLYRALGFEPFGPVVGTEEAPYQPMLLTLEKFAAAAKARRSLQRHGAPVVESTSETKVNLLPGPVAVSARVLAAVGRPPVPHRAPEFMDALAGVRRRLVALVNGVDVQVMPGSGSLGNDVVGGQIAGLKRPGLVISTGEFGERLADHARRAGLQFHWERLPWGTPLTNDVLERAARQTAPDAGWVWLVHHETSTGVLHDLGALKAFAAAHRFKLCLDCISSIGAVRVDLSGVHLASCVSGKGLASLPGLAIVFHAEKPAPRPDLPRYLDLGMWAACDGVPFTHSSNLVAALDVALAEVERLPAGRCELHDDARWLRDAFRSAGFVLGAEEPHASPIIITVKLPESIDVVELGARLEARGFLTSHRSGYLAERNWIQFCLMATPSRAVLVDLVNALRETAAELGLPVEQSELTATAAR